MEIITYLKYVGDELVGLNDDPKARESVLSYAEALLAEALEKVVEVRDDSDSAS